LPIADFIIKLVPPPQGKDVPPGLCSTWMHQDLKPGDRVDIGKPLGALWVSGDSRRPIVLVAGGIGVAPFVCLLEHWFEIGLNESRAIHLFMGARQRRDLILDEQLAEWARRKRNFHYIRALSHVGPEDQWTGETGFISAAVDRHFAGVLDADAFVSGSPVMIRVTEKVLNGKGVPEQRIRHDPIDVQ
jgi:NAD(P)H-flavin reductase